MNCPCLAATSQRSLPPPSLSGSVGSVPMSRALGRQHVRGSTITFTQYKDRNREPKQLTLPILPALQAVIDSTPNGDLTFLVNDLGRPFTDAGFGNKFREWCDQAGLHHCTAHGLRKAGATIAANNGATAFQLMAIFGWSSLKMAEKYTRKANQENLCATRNADARSARTKQHKIVSHRTSEWDIFGKKPAKSKTNFRDGARGGNAAIEKIQWVTTSNPPKTFH